MGRHFRDQVAEDCDFRLALTLFLAPLTCSLLWKPAAMLWATLWRGPCARDWGQPVTNSQRGTESHWQLQEWLWKWILSRLSLEMSVGLANILIPALWKNLSQRTLLSCAWIPDLQKLWHKYSYFKPCAHCQRPHPQHTDPKTSTSQPASISLHVSLSRYPSASLVKDKIWGIFIQPWGLVETKSLMTKSSWERSASNREGDASLISFHSFI